MFLTLLTWVVCVGMCTHISLRTGIGDTVTFLLTAGMEFIQVVKGNHRFITFHRPSLCTGVTLKHSDMLPHLMFTALGGSYHPRFESEVWKFGQVAHIETTEK